MSEPSKQAIEAADRYFSKLKDRRGCIPEDIDDDIMEEIVAEVRSDFQSAIDSATDEKDKRIAEMYELLEKTRGPQMVHSPLAVLSEIAIGWQKLRDMK